MPPLSLSLWSDLLQPSRDTVRPQSVLVSAWPLSKTKGAPHLAPPLQGGDSRLAGISAALEEFREQAWQFLAGVTRKRDKLGGWGQERARIRAQFLFGEIDPTA